MADKDELARRDYDASAIEVPPSISPDDLFRTIQTVAAPLATVERPGFFRMLVTPGAADYVREIEKAKTEQVKARRRYIEGLSNMIDIYIKVHEDQLRSRGTAALIATFAN